MKLLQIFIVAYLLFAVSSRLLKKKKNKNPTTTQQVRDKITAHTYAGQTEANLVTFITERVKELGTMKLAIPVKGQDGLIEAYKKELIKTKKLPEEDAKNNAKGEIERNRSSAFTSHDDKYYYIDGTPKFDEVHEFVHICSSPGGLNKLRKYSNVLNEVLINHYAEKVSPNLTPAVAIVQRYNDQGQMDYCKKLIHFVHTQDAANGPGLIFGAIFRNDHEALINFMAEKLANSGNNLPNGKAKGFSEKKFTKVEWLDFLNKNFADFSGWKTLDAKVFYANQN